MGLAGTGSKLVLTSLGNFPPSLICAVVTMGLTVRDMLILALQEQGYDLDRARELTKLQEPWHDLESSLYLLFKSMAGEFRRQVEEGATGDHLTLQGVVEETTKLVQRRLGELSSQEEEEDPPRVNLSELARARLLPGPGRAAAQDEPATPDSSSTDQPSSPDPGPSTSASGV